MGTGESNVLVRVYRNRIGVPTTGDEAYGYWIFVLGVLAGFVGLAMVMLSDSPGQDVRGAGIAIAALGLVFLLIGPIIRLHLKRGATYLSLLGALISIVAIGVFMMEYLDGNWGAAFEHNEVEIIGLYGVGILAIAIGSIFVPLLTSPREDKEAAERRAAQAEAERDMTAAESERRAQEIEKRAAELAEEQRERELLEDELTQISASQSQFELYTDGSDRHRWRLRHRNRNIIADSAQGYSSRQKAQQGLSAVKRDAFGAAVIDLDRTDTAIDDVDEAVEGEDAPAFVPEIDSRASYETYQDEAGEHRWRLRHDNGNILADSGEGYSSASGRNDAVERVKLYVQSADYLKIDPSAFELYRDQAGEYRWRLLHENGNILADSGQGYSSRQKARQGVDSVQRNASDDGNGEFELYEDNAGEYRWRLRHANGNIIADGGEGYSSEDEAENAIERIRTYAPEAHVLDIGSAAFEIYEDEGEEYRWRLRHRNGNILADSGQGYASRSGAEDGIIGVKQNGPNADVTETES